MPLFYFHFVDGVTRHVDDLGLELPDVEAAYLEAVASARSMGSELITDGVNPAHCAFDIADADNTPLLSVAFSELFERGGLGSMRRGTPTDRVILALEDTHRRALAAKAGLAQSLSQARATLADSHALLSKIGSLER